MKIKLGVFFGGETVEHEVSIISAIQAINYLNKDLYDVIPIYITRDNKMYTGDAVAEISEYTNTKRLLDKSQRIVLVNEDDKVNILKYPVKKFGNNILGHLDAAFPIVHGTNVEDGALQGYFKSLSLPFVGCDVCSSAVCMDKYVMKTILKDNKIPVLDCIRLNTKEYADNQQGLLQRIEDELLYPVIVKPINLGSSIGIKKAASRDELIDAIDYAFEFSQRILVENVVQNLKEINCSVLGDYESAQASECEEPVNTDEILSYKDKYIGGGESSKGMASTKRKLPADITAETREHIRDLAVKTFNLLCCNGVVRIDFLMDSEKNFVWVNEINPIPGSLSFYLWEPVGMKYGDLLDKMIQLALKRDRESKNLSYSIDTNILSGVKLDGLKGTKKVGF